MVWVLWVVMCRLVLTLLGLYDVVRVTGIGKTACSLRTMLHLNTSGTLRWLLLRVSPRSWPVAVGLPMKSVELMWFVVALVLITWGRWRHCRDLGGSRLILMFLGMLNLLKQKHRASRLVPLLRSSWVSRLVICRLMGSDGLWQGVLATLASSGTVGRLGLTG